MKKRLACRLCGSTREPTRHHVIPQSMRTRTDASGAITIGLNPGDVLHPKNTIPLCRHHHNLIENGELRGAFRDALHETEVMHIERVAPGFLDTYYPRGTENG